MRFSLFAHLERIDDDQTHESLYAQFLELCRMADDGGMHAIWTGEHHGMEFTISPNPLLPLVDLAHHTKRVRLGTGTVIAPFWHPVKLAGEAAYADLITGGRLDLGIARGAYAFEYERLMPGLDALEAGERMREIVPLLRELWNGDCAHHGKYYQFPATTAMPRPLQDGGPPLWIAARDPLSHEFAVQQGCNVQVTPLWQGEEEIRALYGRFDEACAGYEGPRPKIMLLHHTFVGRDDADVELAARELSRFYGYFGAWFKNQRPVTRGRIAPLSKSEIDANAMMAPQNLRRDLTLGTAREVIERLKRYEDLGYDEYSFWIDSGMSAARKRESLARFIDEVMPAFA